MGSWFAILQKKCTSQARGLGFALWSNRFLSWVNMVPRKPNIPLQDRRMDPVLDQSRRFDGKVRALSRSSFPTASRAAICRSNFGAFHRNERWLAQHSKAMKNSWKLSRQAADALAGCRCRSSSRDKIEILSEKALRSELVMLGNRPWFLIRKLHLKTTKDLRCVKLLYRLS